MRVRPGDIRRRCLTARELEVLRLAAAGWSNCGIPAELFILVKTASVHVSNGGVLFSQVLCDAGLAPCPAGATYPKPNGTVIMKPLPSGLPTMPNPCAGVPANPWCPAHHGGGYVQPAAAVGSLALIAVPAAGWRSRRRPRIR